MQRWTFVANSKRFVSMQIHAHAVHNILASFPGPAHLSIASSAAGRDGKLGGTWGRGYIYPVGVASSYDCNSELILGIVRFSLKRQHFADAWIPDLLVNVITSHIRVNFQGGYIFPSTHRLTCHERSSCKCLFARGLLICSC